MVFGRGMWGVVQQGAVRLESVQQRGLFRIGRFGLEECVASFLCDGTECWAGMF